MVSLIERQAEVAYKLTALRELMVRRRVNTFLLNTTINTAWITAGATMYINEACCTSPSSIVITPSTAYLVTDQVEAPRLIEEEFVRELGFSVVIEPWYRHGSELGKLLHNTTLAVDAYHASGYGIALAKELQTLRMTLLPSEIVRYRETCAIAAIAMNETMRAIRPGMTELEVMARLSAACRIHDGQAIVMLVASDERIARFRHPIPTAKPIEHYFMTVLCMRRNGLIASLTRLVHFGLIPDELRDKMAKVARVDAQLIAATQPGRTLGDIYEIARNAYEIEGYADTINFLHQGGSIGYDTREKLATPGNMTPIALNQAFAWNPTLPGVKSEDTILLSDQTAEVLTTIADWPLQQIQIAERIIERPAMLEI
jgi:Xaa-Pro aminopeptidase